MLELPSLHWSEYRRRLQNEHGAGWISAGQYLALVALADLTEAGDACPTVAKIASYGRISPATVRRARAVAESREILHVTPQFVLEDGRRQQRANRYQTLIPAGVVTPKPRPSRPNQAARPIGRKEERVLRKGGDSVARSPVNLLIARQRAMTEILAASRTNRIQR